MSDLVKEVRIGIIGMGRQGKIHSRNIVSRIEGARLVCVSDIYIDSAKEFVASLDRSIDVYEDYRDIIKREDVDAVIIASPTTTHEQVITDAANANKHIFCEKPIAPDLATTDRLIELVEKTGVKFMVGFNRRFDPTFKRVKDLVVNGNVGEPQILLITSRDPAPPHLEYLKASGGIFFDTTIHDFDMARYLVDDEVTEVYATGNVLVDPRVKEFGDLDTTMVTLKFKNGAIASINNSRQAVYGYDQRVEVFGSKGSAQAFNETPNTVMLFDEDGVHSDKPLYFNEQRYPESFVNEVSAFVECIRNNTAPPVAGIDGKIPVLMAMAAKKSFDENRPITIDSIQAEVKGGNTR